MKYTGLGFLVLLLLACGCASRIDYTPDVSHVKDPISTIRDTLEQQPPAYAYLPVKVEVTEQVITLHLVESGMLPVLGGGNIVPKILYYRNLGDPKLSKSARHPIWHVELCDKMGNDLYWVYTTEERAAKEFINALHYMIQLQNRR
jgi:hypothetical protein